MSGSTTWNNYKRFWPASWRFRVLKGSLIWPPLFVAAPKAAAPG
jgi:hypothetical protein